MEIKVNNFEDIYVYYRYRNFTGQQMKFIEDLIKSLLHFFDSTIDIKKNYEDENIISKKLFEFLNKNQLYVFNSLNIIGSAPT